MITSKKSERIKRIRSLLVKKKLRESLGVFLVEGDKEISMALLNGYEIQEKYYPETYPNACTKMENCYVVSKDVMKSITIRATEPLGVFSRNNVQSTSKSFEDKILILDGLEKPGNYGAIFRTCEALGIHDIVVTNTEFDIYSPQVIRNSLGTVFSLRIHSYSQEQIMALFKEYSFISAIPEGRNFLRRYSFPQKTALVVGNEHHGISNFFLDKSIPLTIEMKGNHDSLNVSVATAIFLYAMTTED